VAVRGRERYIGHIHIQMCGPVQYEGLIVVGTAGESASLSEAAKDARETNVQRVRDKLFVE